MQNCNEYDEKIVTLAYGRSYSRSVIASALSKRSGRKKIQINCLKTFLSRLGKIRKKIFLFCTRCSKNLVFPSLNRNFAK